MFEIKGKINTAICYASSREQNPDHARCARRKGLHNRYDYDCDR